MAKKIEKINNGSKFSPKGYNKTESWDAETINELASHYHRILKLLGEDPDREGLLNTPVRVAKAMNFLTLGYGQNPCEILNSAKFKEDYKQMVIVKDIELYSMCEHHMLPFSGKASIAYIPRNGKIIGLNTLAKLVDCLSKRLQIQERLTKEIADHLVSSLSPQGVMVVIKAEHLCMTMRGAKKPGSITLTSAVRGVFRKL